MRLTWCLLLAPLTLLPGDIAAQAAPRDIRQQANGGTPAATKLEAFKPTPGSLVTLGYEDLGDIAFGRVRVDVREMRDSKGGIVRGVLVRVSDNQFHQEDAYIDPDEIPDLLRGIDAIIRTRSNPTTFKAFELRYVTRGELEVSAYNTDAYVQYAITAGRQTKATAVNLNGADISRFRAMLLTANDRLNAAATGR